ncbi:MAG: heavy-metal-associated domain-containing protein [Synechococcales bacterium]|nr:heavy-metal-associated domain-containing protein [Synechococcales bacterium]
MKFDVPTVVCQGCVDTITSVIKVADPQASVDVSIDQKTVSVDTEMSESSVRQAITSVGHEVKG